MYLVSVIISAIVMLFACLILCSKLSNTQISSLFEIKKIIIYILLNIIFVINILMFNNLNKVLINIFIVLLLNLTVILEYDYKKSTYYTIIYFLLCIISEFIISGFYSLLYSLNLFQFNNISIETFFFSIANSIIILLFSNSKKLKYAVEKVSQRLKLKTKNLLLLIFLLIYLIALCFNNYLKFGENINYVTNLGMFIFIIISLIFVFNNTLKRIEYENEYNVLQRNLSMYEKEVNRQGKKNHEYNNQLMVIRGYLNNPKKLKEYLDLITEEHKGGQNYRIKQLGYLPDGGFKGLIYNKLTVMEDNDIKSYLYVSSELKNLLEDIDMKYYSDLTKIFGVFIDNAIDATKNADKKEIVLDIKVDDNYLVIEISNTYSKDVDLKKIGKKGYSSKGIGHGFGLSIVRDIKNSNEFIDTFNDIEGEMFKQTIMAKIK